MLKIFGIFSDIDTEMKNQYCINLFCKSPGARPQHAYLLFTNFRKDFFGKNAAEVLENLARTKGGRC